MKLSLPVQESNRPRHHVEPVTLHTATTCSSKLLLTPSVCGKSTQYLMQAQKSDPYFRQITSGVQIFQFLKFYSVFVSPTLKEQSNQTCMHFIHYLPILLASGKPGELAYFS